MNEFPPMLGLRKDTHLVVVANRQSSIFPKVERWIKFHLGFEWHDQHAFQFIDLPAFRSPGDRVDLVFRQSRQAEWIANLKAWLDADEPVAEILFQWHSNDIYVDRDLSDLKSALKLYDKVKFFDYEDRFEKSLLKFCKSHKMDLESTLLKQMVPYNYWEINKEMPQIEEYLRQRLDKWKGQFHKDEDTIRARDLILRSLKVLPTAHLVDHLALRKEEGPYFLFGGTSDCMIKGPANRQIRMEDFHQWPKDGNLWANGSATAITLTDWSESGKQIGQHLDGSKDGLVGSAVKMLAANRRLKLIIRAAWITELAELRLRWIVGRAFQGKPHQDRFELQYPSHCKLMNVTTSNSPNFAGGQEFDSVIPEWLLRAEELFSWAEVKRAAAAVDLLTKEHFPSLASSEKHKLGICTVWPHGAGEHNLPLLVREGEKSLSAQGKPIPRPLWIPLFRNALRPRH